jgi:hypothetical protein
LICLRVSLSTWPLLNRRWLSAQDCNNLSFLKFQKFWSRFMKLTTWERGKNWWSGQPRTCRLFTRISSTPRWLVRQTKSRRSKSRSLKNQVAKLRLLIDHLATPSNTSSNKQMTKTMKSQKT